MSQSDIRLQGRQVILRRFTLQDVEKKVQWINDPLVNRYLHYALPLEVEKTREWFKKVSTRKDRYDLVIETPDGRPIGVAGLLNVNEKDSTAEYYIAIGEQGARGKGLGRAALETLFTWAFQELKLNKIWGTARTTNAASIALMRKLGFCFEGVSREEKRVDGKPVDIIRAGLLRRDWRNPKKIAGLQSMQLNVPSPLLEMPAASNQMSLDVLIKRDDLLGTLLGGNKLRKLESILPRAVEQGADTLITTGSFESNHACLTAVAARKLGMKPVLVLMGPQGHRAETFNQKIQKLLDAEIHEVYFTPANRDTLAGRVDRRVEECMEKLRARGRTPFFVPPGGCCLEGSYAYVEAFEELHRQMQLKGIEQYTIVLAVGTGSTYAGLWCGARKTGANVRVQGISIARKNPRCLEETRKAADRLCDYLDMEKPGLSDLHISDSYVGDGYACPTQGSAEGIKWGLEKEGILFDHTYTGKAFGALMDLVNKKQVEGPCVFWHTGGVSGFVDFLSLETKQQ